jgi:hypothetical protein
VPEILLNLQLMMLRKIFGLRRDETIELCNEQLLNWHCLADVMTVTGKGE